MHGYHCILVISFLLALVGTSAANSAIVIQSKTANAVAFTFSGVNAENFDHYEVKVEDLIGNKVVFTQKYDKVAPVVVEQLEAEKSYMIVVSAFDRTSTILASSVLPFDTFAERHARDAPVTTTQVPNGDLEYTTPTGAPAETTTPAPTPVPVGSAAFKVAANVNVSQSFKIIPQGVNVEVAFRAGAFAGPVTVRTAKNLLVNLTQTSGYITTSTSFNITAESDSTKRAAAELVGDGMYITLSGGEVDQNTYLFVVKADKTLQRADETCQSGNSRVWSKNFKLTTRCCALGDFVVARYNTNNKTNCVALAADKLLVGSYPVLDIDNTKYVNNTLFTGIVAPLVVGRSYTKLTVDGANATMCTMGTGAANNVWSQSFVACHDVLKLSLKWVDHTTCGFTKSKDTSDLVEFHGKILLEYSDVVGNFSSVAVTRTTQHNYDIYISFPKNLVVTFEGLNVTSDVGIDVALTAEKYKAATQELSVELTTAVVWSYMLDGATASFGENKPTGVNVGAITVDSSACLNNAGSLCVQKLSFNLKLNEGNNSCTFDGAYKIAINLVSCRDSASCSSSPTTMDFYLYSGPVCTSFTVAPKVTGTLRAYAEANSNSQQITNFKLGDKVFFFVNIQAGVGNNVAIKFKKIGFDEGHGAGFKWLLDNGEAVPTYSAVSVEKNEPLNYFSLYLTGSVFKIPYETTATYVFNATVDLIFDGNTKRTVDASWKVGGSLNTLTRLYIEPEDEIIEDYQDPEIMEGANENGDLPGDEASLAVVIGAVVGVVAFNVLVSMLVIAFYKKMTNQHRYTQVQQSPVA